MTLLRPPTVPRTLPLSTLLSLSSLFTFTFEHINRWKRRLFMPSWEREAFSTTRSIIWMSNSNCHYYCCYFAQGTTEKESEGEMERDESFNKALARPVCGPHRRIKSCFHRSHSPSASTAPPPTQCQVLLWDTQQRARVCACVLENACPFARQQYIEAPLKKTWTFSELVKHTYPAMKISLSVGLSYIYIHTHTLVLIKGPAGVFRAVCCQEFLKDTYLGPLCLTRNFNYSDSPDG